MLAIMPLGGVAWALVNTNALPAVWACRLLAVPPARSAVYVTTTLASILSPVVNGWLIDAGGGDYNLAILSTSVVAGLAVLTLLVMGRFERAGGER